MKARFPHGARGLFACLALAVILGAWPGPAGAKDKDIDPNFLAIKDCPGEPGCAALILRDATELSNSKLQAQVSRRQMIKVFTEEGIAKYSDVDVSAVVGTTEVHNLSGRTILPSGAVLPLKQENIFVKLTVKRGKRRIRTKTAKFPGIVPGAIVEYSYDLVSTRASNYTEYTWDIQKNLPALESDFLVKAGEMTFSTIAGGLHHVDVTRSSPQKNASRFTARNVPSIPNEPFSPPADVIRARMYLYLPHLQAGWLGEMAGKISGYAGNFIGDAAGVHAKVKEVVGDQDTPLEKVKKIYQFVQRDIGTEEKRAEQTEESQVKDPNNVDEVLKMGYGDESDRTLLFIAMAREAGLPSALLVVVPRDGAILDTEAPDEDQFGTFAAAVKTGGSSWTFYDPAVRHCPFGMVSANKEGGVPNAIKVTPQKGAGAVYVDVISSTLIGRNWPAPYTLAAIPFSAAGKNVLMREATVRLSPDGTAEVEVSEQGSGLADLDQRERYEDLDDEKRRSELADRLHDMLPRAQLISASFEDIGSFDKTATIRYTFTVPEAASSVADRIILTPSLFDAERPTPFTTEKRVTPVHFPHAQKTVHSIRFEIPAGYEIADLPKGGILRDGPFVLVTTYSQDGATLLFSRRLEIDVATWGVEGYPQIKSFFEKVQEADRQVVLLKRIGPS